MIKEFKYEEYENAPSYVENSESVSVTYNELHSQNIMAKRFFRKFMVALPELIPSEYEKVENFVILKERTSIHFEEVV